MAKSLKIQIGERILEILAEKGLKQQDLADMAGSTKSYISQIIHGTVNVTVETIEVLEKALKAPIVTVGKR
jgi:transcriptional regulator with XRE-family HTH domain